MPADTNTNSGPGYAKYAGYTVTFEPIAEEVVVRLGEEVVCRTTEAIRVLESRHKAALYLPKSALAAEHLTPSDTSTYCPFKGTASYQGLKAGATSVADALWYYPEPYDEVDFIRSYFGVYIDRVGAITLDGASVPIG